MPAPHDDFRANAHAAIDFLIDYWHALDTSAAPPVQSRAQPGTIAAQLPRHAPEDPEPFDALLRDVRETVLPGLTHWQSPNFFAYFPANSSPPAVLGELLAAGLGVNGMLWSTSPACTEVETRVLDWLAHALDLPARFRSDAATNAGTPTGGGMIQGTASEAAVVALVAARHRARTRLGRDDAPLIAYTSAQAHSSIAKAALITGLAATVEPKGGFLAGPHGSGLRLIPTLGPDHPTPHAIDPAALAQALAADRAAGKVPCFIAATSGTTSSCAFDDLAAVGTLAREHDAWMHVDAAYAGSAWLCPEFRAPARGLEHADSFCFNPHKWLLTTFDCTAFYTADRSSLTAALSITPEYLRNAASASGQVIDYRDWQIPLGRRFRALKLWFVLRSYGLAHLRAYLREHVRLAGVFADLLASDPRFELAAPPALSLVCFRLKDRDDAAQRRLLDAVNATGRLFLTHTVLPAASSSSPRVTLRLAIGAATTREDHVRRAFTELSRAADL